MKATRTILTSRINPTLKRKHWILVPKSTVPTGMKILPSVWSMKRKRRVATGQVYKHKARLNVHGGKQEHGVTFWEMYLPVVHWFTIRFFVILAILFNWHTRQVDFILAFPQANIECEMYMAIPRGFTMPDGLNPRDYCLKLRNCFCYKSVRILLPNFAKFLAFLTRAYNQTRQTW